MRKRNQKISYGGKSLTIHGWAAKLGVLPTTIYNRLDNGWDEVAAVSTPKHVNAGLYTHNGETLTLREWAKRTKITHHALYMRVVKLGWDFERALTTPPRQEMELDGRMEIPLQHSPGHRMSYSL